MGVLRKLAGQSAIYGLSSVVPRLLNYFLVVLHSRVLVEAEYGVVTELYAYIAVLMVLLTFGLETGFFRFANPNDRADGEKTYASVFYFLLSTSALFVGVCTLFSRPIAAGLGYQGQEGLILLTAAILGVDAWQAIVFDKLRWLQRPLAFSAIKIAGVAINVGCNILFLVGFPRWGMYNANFGAGYILLSNLFASLFTLMIALVASGGFPRGGGWRRLRPLLVFSFPLLISGLGGTTNEFMDRVFIKWLTPANEAMAELGIYGANAKIAVLLVLFIQMFKFAAEPFFFAQAQTKNDPNVYALVTKWFTYFCIVASVGIMLYLPLLQYFVGARFRVGLGVVPILLLANLLYGFFFNISFWFKILKKTWYGVLLTFSGAAVTVLVNLLLTPRLGYYGAAAARVASYTCMVAMCLAIGQRHFHIPYQYGRMLLATAIGGVMLAIGWYLPIDNTAVLIAIRTVVLMATVELVVRREGKSLMGLLRYGIGIIRRQKGGKG